MKVKEFPDLLTFAVHLAEVNIAVAHAESKLLDHAATIIEKRAKSKLGEYQGEVGPFPAWAPLADATVQQRTAQGFAPDDPLLRTGALRESISHLTDGNQSAIGSDSPVAVYQELGTSRIPPRPFIGPAAVESRGAIEKALGEALAARFEYGASGAFSDLQTEP